MTSREKAMRAARLVMSAVERLPPADSPRQETFLALTEYDAAQQELELAIHEYVKETKREVAGGP